jgi:polysaccharide pyruvyl transferase WcaK-like protein
VKCLLVNEAESANVGDQAIAEALSDAVRSLGHSPVQADFSSGRRVDAARIGSRPPARRAKRMGLAVPKWVRILHWCSKSWRPIRDTCREGHDLALIGGGQLILSNGHFVAALATWSFFLRRHRVPYALVGCGAGSTFKRWERWLLRRVARGAQGGVHLRDRASCERVAAITGVACGFIPDLAFMLSPPRHAGAGDGDGVRRVALSVADYDVYRRYCPELGKTAASEDRYLEEWCELSARFARAGAALVLVGTAPGDARQTEKLQALLAARSVAATRVPEPRSWREYCDRVADCSLVVSGRMHGLILARIAGVAVQPYIVSRKLEAFAAEFLDAPPADLGRQARGILASVIDATCARSQAP